MRKEYDFGDARRGAPIANKGKSRITILLDQDILDAFRGKVREGGRGYQTAINQALREHLEREQLETTLRRVLREELDTGMLPGVHP